MMNLQQNLTVEAVESIDKFEDDVINLAQQPYCFGIYFNKFDLENNDYEVTLRFDKNSVPDTN